MEWLEEFTFNATNFTQNGRSISQSNFSNCDVQNNISVIQSTHKLRGLESLAEYYSKSTIELAIQYCKNPDSLTSSEYKRLQWEAGRNEQELLEKHFGPENQILKEINKRMKIRLPSGYKLMK